MSNGGSPIVGYDVERRERSSAGRWAKITRSPIKVNGLEQSNFITDVFIVKYIFIYRLLIMMILTCMKANNMSIALVQLMLLVPENLVKLQKY